MKIEICDNTFWLTLWAVIVIGVAGIILGSQRYYNQRLNTIVSAGYVEKMVPYTSTAVWQKP